MAKVLQKSRMSAVYRNTTALITKIKSRQYAPHSVTAKQGRTFIAGLCIQPNDLTASEKEKSKSEVDNK